MEPEWLFLFWQLQRRLMDRQKLVKLWDAIELILPLKGFQEALDVLTNKIPIAIFRERIAVVM